MVRGDHRVDAAGDLPRNIDRWNALRASTLRRAFGRDSGFVGRMPKAIRRMILIGGTPLRGFHPTNGVSVRLRAGVKSWLGRAGNIVTRNVTGYICSHDPEFQT
jgi:hypothetical protein